jgi:hypothetical protein
MARETVGYLRYPGVVPCAASPPYLLLQIFSAKLGIMIRQYIAIAPNTPTSESA